MSELGDVLYFTEVKYRRRGDQGGGITAITPAKLKQMKFASDMYVQVTRTDRERRLSVISLTGEPPRVDAYLKSVE